MSTMSTALDASPSGSPRMTVLAALTWSSGPDIVPVVATAWMSWRVGAVAPTTTILPRTSAGLNVPRHAVDREIVGTVPAG